MHADEWEQHEKLFGEHKGEHHGGYGEHRKFYSDWRKSAKAVGVDDKIEYQHLIAEDLPFPEETFDAVFMYDTLQHIKDRTRALAFKECLRVAKPNGVICIIETNENGIEFYKRTERFTIDLVDPRDFISRKDISVEVVIGKLLNAYILRKMILQSFNE